MQSIPDITPEQFDAYLAQQKRRKESEIIDSMTPGQREIIHEYGFATVALLLSFGVEDPKEMINIIHKSESKEKQLREEVNGSS